MSTIALTILISFAWYLTMLSTKISAPSLPRKVSPLNPSANVFCRSQNFRYQIVLLRLAGRHSRVFKIGELCAQGPQTLQYFAQ